MSSFERELDVYLRARFTLLLLVTSEEERALEAIKGTCEASRRQAWMWDLADGYQVLCGDGGKLSGRDPLSALEQAEKHTSDGVFVLKDFHEGWANPQIKRKLKNLAQRFKYARKTLIVIAPTSQVPPELRDELVVVDFPSPDIAELEAVLDQLSQNPNVRESLTPLGREKLVQAALGLSSSQARRVFGKAIAIDGNLDDRDIELVTQEKKLIIRESEALEYYAVTETPDDVGGLDVLKDWLRLRERAFTADAHRYGLPPPKGIALIGIPGTGKSLTAKMIGGLWRLPLLRLDFGALFGSLVGESEERTRRALRVAETVAPCVVWVDEIEKGISLGGLDGGTSTRVFGTVLTWMQEKSAPCFVVATANDISALPPELLRKGRFDEIFFLDLPTAVERDEIFSVHLRKRRRLPDDFGVAELARVSEGYVGAEIEQAIVDAMFEGFAEGREFTTDDIQRALRRQVPLSVSQREAINALRSWLREGRARSASFREAAEAESSFVPIELPAG
jgi:AAA+ superfamily predicted ATPase